MFKDLRPDSMNIELTTKCPLRCPQCYCTLEGGKNIDPEIAIRRIREAGQLGVTDVMLSGGETLCYPHLIEVVCAVKEFCGRPHVALSGYHFTQEIYEKLVESGVYGIFISINGSTPEINALTRDGYDLAISALELLQRNQFPRTTINWVMHSSNSDDFPNMINLAERYNVGGLTVLGAKPDSSHALNTLPSYQQMVTVKNHIKAYRGPVHIQVETCYSPMLALVSQTKMFGNLNVGIDKGCGAGLTSFSINVDGQLSPCRHLDYFESFETLADYWNCSPVLKSLREMHQSEAQSPCNECRFLNHCRPCAAINAKLEGKLYRGNRYCPISQETIV